MSQNECLGIITKKDKQLIYPSWSLIFPLCLISKEKKGVLNFL